MEFLKNLLTSSYSHLAILVATVIAILGINPEPPEGRWPKPLYRRISWKSYLSVVLLIAGAWFSIDKDISDRKVSQKKSAADSIALARRDSINMSDLKKQLMGFNLELRNGIISLKTKELEPVEEMPIVDIFQAPTIKKNSAKKWEIVISVHSVNGLIAYYPRDVAVLVTYPITSSHIPGKPFRPAFNESTIVTSDKGLLFTYKPVIEDPLPDTCYFYFNLKYKNKNGIERLPMRGIYRIESDSENRPLSYANSSEYSLVKKYLVANKLWTF